MNFQCLLCNYTTERKNNLKKHVNTLKHSNKLDTILLGYTQEEKDAFVFDTCMYIDGETIDNTEQMEHIVLYHKSSATSQKTSKHKSRKKTKQNTIEYNNSAELAEKKTPPQETSNIATNYNSNITITLTKQRNSKKNNAYKSKQKIANSKKVATKETPYCCEYCGEFFTRNDNLKRHKRDHCKVTVTNIKEPPVSLIKQNNESNEILQERIAQLQSRLEMETEHFRGILAEKERLIGVLREKHKHITTAHFQVIQNKY